MFDIFWMMFEVTTLYFLKDWWKSFRIDQNNTGALMSASIIDIRLIDGISLP